jgi:uncharacterized protein
VGVKSRALYSAEPHRGWLPWGALAPLLGLLFVIIPLLSYVLGLEHSGLLDANGDPVGLPGIFLFLLVPFAGMGLLVLGWVRFIERRPLPTIGFTRPRGAATFARGALLGCATILAVVIVSWLAGGFKAMAFVPALRSPTALLSIAGLLLCFLVQASVEEIIFRGWMLSAIARKFNVAWAVILSSLIFCLLHYGRGQHWLVTLNLALFALFACSWAIRTENIWGVMGWHAGWNWLLATGFQLPVTGLDVKMPALLIALEPQGSDYLTGGTQGPEGSIACTVFFVAGILLLANRGMKRRVRSPKGRDAFPP